MLKVWFERHWWWIISVLIAVFSLISAISIFIHNEISFGEWNSDGFQNFLFYFDFPLKGLAASVVVLTICLSIVRLYKAEQQIRISESGSLRSNYLELASSYQGDFKVMKLDLKRNINYFFPEIEQGRYRLTDFVKNALTGVVATISNVEKAGDLGIVSGLSLFPILLSREELKKSLLIEFNIKLDSGLKLRDCLVQLSKELVALIEFLSNFDEILIPSVLNKLKGKLDDLKAYYEHVDDLFEQAVNDYHNTFDPDRRAKNGLLNFDFSYGQKLFIMNNLSKYEENLEMKISSWSRSQVPFLIELDSLISNDNSDLIKYRSLLQSIGDELCKEEGDLMNILSSNEYKDIIKLE